MAKKKQKSAEELFGVAVADRFSSSNEDDGDYSGITFLDKRRRVGKAPEENEKIQEKVGGQHGWQRNIKWRNRPRYKCQWAGIDTTAGTASTGPTGTGSSARHPAAASTDADYTAAAYADERFAADECSEDSGRRAVA